MVTVGKTINYIARKPRKLFLIDSLGAMLTASVLLIIWNNFNEYFGMPQTILIYLSIIATSFCIYSAVCFVSLKQHWAFFLRAISIANLLYAILTIGLLIIYYTILSIIGIIYFGVEIAIIGGLAYIEFKVAAAIKQIRVNNNR